MRELYPDSSSKSKTTPKSRGMARTQQTSSMRDAPLEAQQADEDPASPRFAIRKQSIRRY